MNAGLAIAATLIVGALVLASLGAVLLYVDGEAEIDGDWFWSEMDGEL